MAQELFKSLCPRIDVFSRGLYVDASIRVPNTVRDFLSREGIAAVQHVPVQLSETDMQQADLVLFMENKHLEQVVDRFAQYTDKCYLLLDFAYGKEQEIADPIGLRGWAFDKQADLLRRAVAACAQKLSN